MHTTIAIPADVPVYALAAAMRTIGLSTTQAPGRVLTFDHDAHAAPLCQIDGCTSPADAIDGPMTVCARHWLDSRSPA